MVHEPGPGPALNLPKAQLAHVALPRSTAVVPAAQAVHAVVEAPGE